MTLRVLQVVSRMERAGIETWLMNLLRRVDRSRCRMDFLVHGTEPADYDDEIIRRGSRILRCGDIRNLSTYVRSIRQAIGQGRDYDVIHVHRDYFSGFPLRAAEQLGIPVRIAHSHNDLSRSFSRLRWPVRQVARLGTWLTRRHATHGLAASRRAAETLYGANWERNSRWSVLPCGIELARANPSFRRPEIRGALGIDDGELVIGHVGRFAEQKNHQKIVDVAASLAARGCRFRVVLVGQGPLRSAIEQDVAAKGLTDRFIFAGPRDDVPELFQSLFDVLLFPSKFEGLGLVIVESLAAGCPVVMSDVVPAEADIVPSLITRVPLNLSADDWASAVLRIADAPLTAADRTAAHRAVAASPYHIDTSLHNLLNFYEHCTRAQNHAKPASRAA